MTVASEAAYPRAGLVLEPYALLAWAWAFAVLASARPGGRGSVLAAPGLLVLSVVLALLPEQTAFYLAPGAPGFPGSRVRWVLLLTTGLAALASSCALRGPITPSVLLSRAPLT
jgi:hypothetical protein